MPRSKHDNSQIAIELDKVRHLRFDLNAMSAYEDATGNSSFSIGDNINAKNIRALLWASLIHEDEDLTIKQVGHMIHPGNMTYITNKLNQITKNSSDTGDEPGENDPNESRHE
jgi:hypothetical protein